MSLSEAIAHKAWIGWGRFTKNWHDYKVDGDGGLTPGTSQLLVAYSGRGFALDVIALNELLWTKAGEKHLPLNVFPPGTRYVPPARALMEGIGGIMGYDEPLIADAIKDGRWIVCTPGSSREAARSSFGEKSKYRVDFGDSMDYIKIAVEKNLPVLPVVCAGTDDTYLGLNNGYALGRRLGLKADLPWWLGIGIGGFVPFALPFPAQLRQRIGAPYELKFQDETTKKWTKLTKANANPARILSAHAKFQADMQTALDAQVKKYAS